MAEDGKRSYVFIAIGLLSNVYALSGIWGYSGYERFLVIGAIAVVWDERNLKIRLKKSDFHADYKKK
ncbi:MAG: hypothetical protein KC643_30325 [Nitrospira sp.]|nr:hypothetical protein [Nitrospira sp.]